MDNTYCPYKITIEKKHSVQIDNKSNLDVNISEFIKAKLKKSGNQRNIDKKDKYNRTSYCLKINLTKNHHSNHVNKAIIL